jgi:hypothetical protein
MVNIFREEAHRLAGNEYYWQIEMEGRGKDRKIKSVTLAYARVMAEASHYRDLRVAEDIVLDRHARAEHLFFILCEPETRETCFDGNDLICDDCLLRLQEGNDRNMYRYWWFNRAKSYAYWIIDVPRDELEALMPESIKTKLKNQENQPVQGTLF